MQLLTLNKTKSYQDRALRENLIEDDTLSNKSSVMDLPKLKNKPSSPDKSLKLNKSKLKYHKKVHAFQQEVIHDNLSVSAYKQNQPQSFKEYQTGNKSFIYNNYELFDLTFSLINADINIKILTFIFFIQLMVRYFSIMCLIYITIQSKSKSWQWVFSLIFASLLYFICIVKISLKPAQTKSQVILKQSFNSLEQNQAVQYFQIISPKKLITSILRGMVPPQFSFLYIKNMKERRLQIYVMINFMYSSIEAVVYYPFFIVYTALIQKKIGVSQIIYIFTLSCITFSEMLFVCLSIYLIVFGCKKKGYMKTMKEK